jgi:hypothetical protein
MRFRITAAVQAGLARDQHKLDHLDVIVGYRRSGVSFPRGRDEGIIVWEVDSLAAVHGLRMRLERALLATLDHTGTNPEPDAMLRSVRFDPIHDRD